jgi:hypothetical protein
LLTGCPNSRGSDSLSSVENNKEIENEPRSLYVDNDSIDVSEYCDDQILTEQQENHLK